jgi:hypothetical protein
MFGSYVEHFGQDMELVLRLQGANPEPIGAIAAAAVTANAQVALAISASGVLAGSSIVGVINYTWPAQSSSIGSGTTGGKNPPIVNIKPNSSPSSSSSSSKSIGCAAPLDAFVSYSILLSFHI